MLHYFVVFLLCAQKRYTPLLIACYYQKIEILKFLLNHGEVSEIAAITIVSILY